MTRASWAAALLLLAAFLIAYGADLGHGFVSDDFTWAVTAREFLAAPSPASLINTSNFLRPLVTLSFALNLSWFGVHAFPFAVTNLLLIAACAVLLYQVARAWELVPAAALTSAGAWAFNFHGINMSLLWISGRTSLLLTLCALLTALLTLKRKLWLAAVCCMLALFSKEEAIALPFVLAVWVGIRAAWPLFVPLAVYFAVRLQTNAFWPDRAPDYYRFTTDAGELVTNAAHYLDRGGTIFLVAALVLTLVARMTPRFSEQDRWNLLRGLVWFAGGYTLTVWVPVRSSLYAVLPSVGSALMLGVLANRVFARADVRARLRTAVVLVALPFLLSPVYRSRNVRWVELADLTSSVVPQLEPHMRTLRAGAPVWIIDDDSTRANVRNAFGGQMDSAVRLHYSVAPQITVVTDASEAPPDALVLRLSAGRLQHGQRIDVH